MAARNVRPKLDSETSTAAPSSFKQKAKMYLSKTLPWLFPETISDAGSSGTLANVQYAHMCFIVSV